MDTFEEGTDFSPSTSISGCCPLSPPSSDVSQLSENTPKSSRRLQAAEKYLSGEARVPFKSINREKSLTLLSPSLQSTSKKQDVRKAACSYCAPRLSKLLPAFQAAGMHGIYLHNRQSANSTGPQVHTGIINKKMNGCCKMFSIVMGTTSFATAASLLG